MKKIILILFLLPVAFSVHAQKQIVIVDKSTLPTRHNSGVPIVNHDGDDVNIRCDSTINDVDIVIRDQYGAVMHQSTQTIGPNETTIYVPSTDGDCEKTTIDLYYDRKHLSGYFEE